MSNYQNLNSFNIDEDDDVFIQPDSQAIGSNKPNPIPKDTASLQDISLASPTNNDQTAPSISTPSSSSRQKVKKTYAGGFFTVNYYRQYFDLDTPEFFSNCYKSLNPLVQLHPDEFQQVGDLYGAIWITATLVFLLFFCNSFAELIGETVSHSSGANVNYFKMIITSINLLYGYIILIPSLLWISLRFYFKVSNVIPLTKLISEYSYSNLLWIPAALLSIFRGLLVNHHTVDSILKWGCIAIGSLLSGLSLIVKLNQYFSIVFDDDQKKNSLILLVVLVVLHLGYSVGVKVCFFGDLF